MRRRRVASGRVASFGRVAHSSEHVELIAISRELVINGEWDKETGKMVPSEEQMPALPEGFYPLHAAVAWENSCRKVLHSLRTRRVHHQCALEESGPGAASPEGLHDPRAPKQGGG